MEAAVFNSLSFIPFDSFHSRSLQFLVFLLGPLPFPFPQDVEVCQHKVSFNLSSFLLADLFYCHRDDEKARFFFNESVEWPIIEEILDERRTSVCSDYEGYGFELFRD